MGLLGSQASTRKKNPIVNYELVLSSVFPTFQGRKKLVFYQERLLYYTGVISDGYGRTSANRLTSITIDKEKIYIFYIYIIAV